MTHQPPSNDPPADLNPYASPQFAPEAATIVAPYELRKTVRAYRSQWHILGATWILMGCGVLVVGGVVINEHFHVMRRDGFFFLLAMAAGIGGPWLLFGICTCCKQLWAVYAGLAFSYLAALATVISFLFCLLVILLPAIVQAHRVLSWVKFIRRRGLPIGVRLVDIESHVIIPPS